MIRLGTVTEPIRSGANSGDCEGESVITLILPPPGDPRTRRARRLYKPTSSALRSQSPRASSAFAACGLVLAIRSFS